MAASTGGAWDVLVGDVAHTTFSDSPFFTPTLRPTRNRANLEIIRDVLLAFFDHANIVAEPSGAVSVAAVLRERPATPGAVAIISGGNVPPEDYAKYITA